MRICKIIGSIVYKAEANNSLQHIDQLFKTKYFQKMDMYAYVI